MRAFIKPAAVILASLVASPSAALPPPGPYEVLGIKLFTSQSAARTIASKAGYKPYSPFFGGSITCNQSYQSFVADKVAKQNLADGMPSCRDAVRTTSSLLTIEYVLSARGYVVSGVEYVFGSPEASKAIVARLSNKFGQPTDDRGTEATWKSNSTDRAMSVQEPALVYKAWSTPGRHSLGLSAGSNSYKAITDEVNVDLSRRLGGTKVAL